ncbi:serine hydrolase domain-containing protein [Sphingomonas kaistensis]|uniref:Serine hydrolase domain-containing protein n=1 Tax=Sphingomonas kaistensis TaxID=298708 RepID=A0ABZ2FZ26_9SPHN
MGQRYGLHGEIAVSRGNDTWVIDTIPRSDNREDLARGGLTGPAGDRVWRWASVTKQVVATMVMQEAAAGRIDLDRPVSRYLPGFKSPNAPLISVRQLLRHQSGLPNPDDTPKDAAGIPGYYTKQFSGSRDPLTGYCAGAVNGAPGGRWSYNNCDYIVAGALLERVTGKPWTTLVRERIAAPLKLASLGAFPTTRPTVSGTVGNKPEPAIDLTVYRASAGLFGTAADLLVFDRALMTGKLLPAKQLAEMWDGQPQLGSIALGQWSFKAPLKGCAAPVRIIERRGEIGGVQVRNFILPEQDTAVAVFTDRGSDDFDFGEVWQGKGLSHDLLAAAACPAA